MDWDDLLKPEEPALPGPTAPTTVDGDAVAAKSPPVSIGEAMEQLLED